MRSGVGRAAHPTPCGAHRLPAVAAVLLTGFVLLPVYVMVSSSLKPLQDVSGTF
ncbi:carbohydrate ABC transporter permease, partial [Streptomyces sp. NPDC127074]